MRKTWSLILIIFLCGVFTLPLVACNKECAEHVDDNGDALCDECGESIEVEIPIVDDENNTDNDLGDNADEVTPKAEYLREVENGVTYIYYGTLPQTAVSSDLNNVLTNLVKSGQLVVDESGICVYAGVEYACLYGKEETAGKKLSSGLTIQNGEPYFFKIEKLKWRVLEEKDGRALLLAENILGEYCFNPLDSYSNSLGTLLGTPNNANDYSVSALRKYVNETLYPSLFSANEMQSVYDTTVLLRPGESAFTLTQGIYNSTVDKMFVPSYWEINEKYNLKVEDDMVRTVEVKDYQVASGFVASAIGERYYASWWLRTSGARLNQGNVVNFDGRIGTVSVCSVNLCDTMGIRPCITIRTA